MFLAFCFLVFLGCFDARSLENLSYAVAIGLDKGENNLQDPQQNPQKNGNEKKRKK